MSGASHIHLLLQINPHSSPQEVSGIISTTANNTEAQ